jgi:hypothetical protein
MQKARYVVDAVVVAGRSVREVAQAYGVSKSWVAVLVGRFRAGGNEALEPRSKRLHHSPRRTSVAVCLQSDVTHVALADGREVEILNFEDDHSRLCIASNDFITVKGLDVVAVFRAAAATWGSPTSVLIDNGAVVCRGRPELWLTESDGPHDNAPAQRASIRTESNESRRPLDSPTTRTETECAAVPRVSLSTALGGLYVSRTSGET